MNSTICVKPIIQIGDSKDGFTNCKMNLTLAVNKQAALCYFETDTSLDYLQKLIQFAYVSLKMPLNAETPCLATVLAHDLKKTKSAVELQTTLHLLNRTEIERPQDKVAVSMYLLETIIHPRIIFLASLVSTYPTHLAKDDKKFKKWLEDGCTFFAT
jgi:hypothetical protein